MADKNAVEPLRSKGFIRQDGRYLKGPDNDPVEAMHGTDADFLEFDGGHAYFTCARNYSYIKNSRNTVVARLMANNPYFPEHQAEIEQLSVFPDRIEELKVAGYDAVIWANKDNITQSKSGWGNDYPQYVVFDPAQIEIIRIDRNAEINESMEPIICYRGYKSRQAGSVDFGASGHYEGTYFFSGEDARRRAEMFGDKITSIDIAAAILYDISTPELAEKLKKMAANAGYITSTASGYGESGFLRTMGYDGIKRGQEVILFDVDRIEERNRLSGRSIDVDGYQKPVRNNEGNMISDNIDEIKRFWSLHGSSCICDENGRPIVAYRGEHIKNEGDAHIAIRTRLGSVSFGSFETAQTYSKEPNNRLLDGCAENPVVISAYICADSVFHRSEDDPFFDIHKLKDVFGFSECMKLAIEMQDCIMNTNNWDENFSSEYISVEHLLNDRPELIESLYLDAYKIFDSHEICEKLSTYGFNGAIHGGNGESALEVEYKIFGSGYAVSIDSLEVIPIIRNNHEIKPLIVDRSKLKELDERVADIEIGSHGGIHKSMAGMGI